MKKGNGIVVGIVIIGLLFLFAIIKVVIDTINPPETIANTSGLGDTYDNFIGSKPNMSEANFISDKLYTLGKKNNCFLTISTTGINYDHRAISISGSTRYCFSDSVKDYPTKDEFFTNVKSFLPKDSVLVNQFGHTYYIDINGSKVNDKVDIYEFKSDLLKSHSEFNNEYMNDAKGYFNLQVKYTQSNKTTDYPQYFALVLGKYGTLDNSKKLSTKYFTKK